MMLPCIQLGMEGHGSIPNAHVRQLVKLAHTFKKHMFWYFFGGKTAGVDASQAKFE